MVYRANTRIFRIDPHDPDPGVIQKAAQVIQRGGLVAFPTETVYGLGANALDLAAVQRIFAAKGRPAADPLIVHISDPAQLELIAECIPEAAERLCTAFWPGPLTVILCRKAAVPAAVSAGKDTLAVRLPDHPVALALIRAAGTPIAAPSANLFMHTSPTTAQHVLDDLEGRVDLILDGGPCTIGVESTVVDLLQDPPVVLRPGGVSMEALQAVMPNVQVHVQPPVEDGELAFASPGLFTRHYAPRARFVLVTGQENAVRAKLHALARDYLAKGLRVGMLVAVEDGPYFKELGIKIQLLGDQDNMEQIAASLFAGMRALDKAGVDVILAKEFGASGLGLAVQDRLVRAAGGSVVQAEG